MESDPRLGVTGIMSDDPPTPKELKLDEALLQELKARNQFEAQEETDRRRAVLGRLESTLKKLVQKIGQQQEIPAGILNEAGGKIFTFGSFELGVHSPRSDMDTLMLAPKHVSREDFFEYMPDLLREEFKPEEITEMIPVPGISVPIIKLELCGVSVDLIFCALPSLQSIPKSQDLNNSDLLRGLNDTDLRCVNGTRVTRRILDLVPQTRVFRTALRAVKLWAKERALYGNIVGFPGGVAYAIMIARVCQLYPKAAAPTIVLKFFQLMKQWHWPAPVLLQRWEEGPLQLREWDPEAYRGDKFQLMPVITPCFPRQNTTHTIGPSTKSVLLSEMNRAEEICKQIIEEGRPWSDLFEKHTFFTNSYKHYISVISSGRTKEAQQAWSGLVESKIKWLIAGIEQSDARSIELVHPFNKGFVRVHECPTAEEVTEVFEGSLEWQVPEIKTQTTEQVGNVKFQAAAQTDTDGKEIEIDESEAAPAPDLAAEGPINIWTTTFYLGIRLKKSEGASRKLDIATQVQEFLGTCREWQHYDEEKHRIHAKHIRNYKLPADLFDEGEKRPERKGKATPPPPPSTNGGYSPDSADKKRTADEAGLDENEDPVKRRYEGGYPPVTPPNGGYS